jgi:hypothetical protein
MNRGCAADFLVTPATHRFAIPASRDLENIVDTTADFAPESQKCRFLHLRSINHNRKGLQPGRPKKHQRACGVTKADTHSNALK